MVAGLALLSTLLVAVLTTRAKLTRQWALARQQIRAVEAADELLTVWWQDVKTFPRQASGRVPREAGLAWRTRVVPNEPVNRLKASVVRLEIIDDGEGSAAGEILVAVEVVLNDEVAKRLENGSDGGASVPSPRPLGMPGSSSADIAVGAAAANVNETFAPATASDALVAGGAR